MAVTEAAPEAVRQTPARARVRKPGAYAAEQARDRVVEIIGDAWQPIAAVCIGWYAFLLALVAFLPHGLPGFFVGVLAVGPPWALSLIIAGDPKVAFSQAGVDGERFTAAECRRAFGRDATVLHDIQLGRTNIDHVVIASPGVIVLETKMSSHPWVSFTGDQKIVQASHQVARAARMVREVLQRAEFEVAVKPAVVLWGGRQRNWTDKKFASEIPVVPGSHFDEWTASLPTDCVPSDQIEAIADALRALSVR